MPAGKPASLAISGEVAQSCSVKRQVSKKTQVDSQLESIVDETKVKREKSDSWKAMMLLTALYYYV